jgi:transcriptional regulator with XRE-family HTH domain
MMKTDFNDKRIAFGQRLKTLRNEKRLTLQDLENRCGIKYSAIAAIETGRRAAGESVAQRLADGLMLRDEEKDQFLIEAMKTKRDPAVGKTAKRLGMEVLQLLHVGGPLETLQFVTSQEGSKVCVSTT